VRYSGLGKRRVEQDAEKGRHDGAGVRYKLAIFCTKLDDVTK
jgi:hypothetical protein